MKRYYRIMLGRKSIYAKECFEGDFIGVDFGIHQDRTSNLPEEWRVFNRTFIPIYLELRPDKTRVAAGLACGALWTVSKGIRRGDIVLCPDGEGHYYIGEVDSEYTYQPNEILPHRRSVKWFSETIDRSTMSEGLKNSTGSVGTVSDVTGHREEIEALLGNVAVPPIISRDETIEDPTAFAMEEHLESFLIQNWSQSPFAKEYDIYQEDGERSPISN